jgi:hypothetical protein
MVGMIRILYYQKKILKRASVGEGKFWKGVSTGVYPYDCRKGNSGRG